MKNREGRMEGIKGDKRKRIKEGESEGKKRLRKAKRRNMEKGEKV